MTDREQEAAPTPPAEPPEDVAGLCKMLESAKATAGLPAFAYNSDAVKSTMDEAIDALTRLAAELAGYKRQFDRDSTFQAELQEENARLAAERDRKSDAIQRLWRERDELRAERDEMREALKAVLPYVATQMVGCHGDKCREPWCYSCNGEEDAAVAAQMGSDALDAANAALARAKESERG